MKLQSFFRPAFKCLLVLLLYAFPCFETVAQESDAVSAVQKALRESRVQEFPVTVELSGCGGILSPVAQYDGAGLSPLGFGGMQVSTGFTHINRFVWERLHIYPTWGINLKYNRLSNRGSFWGGGLYVEPQYDHTSSFEIVPRLGLGVLKVVIPDGNPPQDTEVEVDIPARFQGTHLDALLGFHMKIRLTPHWQVTPGLDLNYLKCLKGAPESHDLKPFSLRLGVGYIPNPSRRRYPVTFLAKRKSRVDVGLSNGLRQLNSEAVDILNAAIPSTSDKISSNKYYYVGGGYVRCSIPISKNHALALGTECVWDGGAKDMTKHMVKKGAAKIGVLLGNEFVWRRLIFNQDFGMHVLNPESIPGISMLYNRPYLRLGAIYRFTDSFFAGIGNKITPNPDSKSWYFGVDSMYVNLGYSF